MGSSSLFGSGWSERLHEGSRLRLGLMHLEQLRGMPFWFILISQRNSCLYPQGRSVQICSHQCTQPKVP